MGEHSVESSETHILIVDDETVILDILEEHLVQRGYSTKTVTSPRLAMDHLRERDVALLLTDVAMPEMSGIELAREARNIRPDMAVIVMTGRSDTTSAIQALRTGADDYVLKPFDFEEILICIERALDKRRLVLENRAYRESLEERVNEATQELEEKNHRLQETEQYLNNLIESTVDAIMTVDPNEKVTFANRGSEVMLGYANDGLEGASVADLFVGGMEEAKYVRRVTTPDKPLQNYETELKSQSGDLVPVCMSISVIPDARNGSESLVAICKDITDQKRLENELKEMTIRDGLTGLYNLRYFYEKLEAEIERAKRQSHPLSLLLLDIDRFKSYNDAHGHLEGDRVLREVARVIEDCTREHVDLGFRYGGDEFTVILPEASEETAYRIAQRIREMFAAKRFDMLTMSIGLMTYHESYSPRTFIQFTDSMMYDAKRAGGNQVTVYRAEDYDAETAVPEPQA